MALLTVFLGAAFAPHAYANWFNRSETYLAACEQEAQHKYFMGKESKTVRHYVHLCMLARRYKYRERCDESGWTDPSCYRLIYKTEGR
jgi:hypothetical protein